jgi:hypothetical protein
VAETPNAGDEIGTEVIARVGLNNRSTELRLLEAHRRFSMEKIECSVGSFWLTGSPIQ